MTARDVGHRSASRDKHRVSATIAAVVSASIEPALLTAIDDGTGSRGQHLDIAGGTHGDMSAGRDHFDTAISTAPIAVGPTNAYLDARGQGHGEK